VKPVFQTHFDEEGTGPGNCMQAVTASYFELPLEAVPNFIELRDPDRRMRDFFKSRGVVLIHEQTWFKPQGLYFATGISTQGHEHIVIMREGRIVHDPNPHGRGLRNVDGILWPRAI
jgi:hypothetical protein